MHPQTATFVVPTSIKEQLVKEFVGKSVDTLRTPAFVVDRGVFADNCSKMHRNALNWGASFRAHLKTHKTAEGSRLELKSSEYETKAVIISTLMEAWQVLKSGLVEDGTVKDMLYGLPIAVNKTEDLSRIREEMQRHDGVLRIIVDHPAQVRFLEEFEAQRPKPERWSVFVKIDQGSRRAGIEARSPHIHSLLHSLLKSPAISVHGFYGHAGNSYSSTSGDQAAGFLSDEVDAVNIAAKTALSILETTPNAGVHSKPFVLSVGSTPTAHATAEAKAILVGSLNGTLELHAGNYSMLDLQQLSTGLISSGDISQRVIATVISYYPGRGENGTDEALCDAGAIAMSKDKGQLEGFGDVIGKPWRLGRISQEHGVLTRISIPSTASVNDEMGEGDGAERLEIGSRVDIVGQHACLIAAAAPWIYVVEGGNTVVDVWETWKGW